MSSRLEGRRLATGLADCIAFAVIFAAVAGLLFLTGDIERDSAA